MTFKTGTFFREKEDKVQSFGSCFKGGFLAKNNIQYTDLTYGLYYKHMMIGNDDSRVVSK